MPERQAPEACPLLSRLEPPSLSDRLGLSTHHQTTSLFIEVWVEKFEPAPDRLYVYHSLGMIP